MGMAEDMDRLPRPQPVLAFCPNCGKEVLKAQAWCVSCGVDFGDIIRALDDEMPDLERRLVTVEGKLLTVMSALIRLGVDIR